jgi:hypothetical protein
MSKFRYWHWRPGRWTIEIVPSFRRPHLFVWNLHSTPCTDTPDDMCITGGINVSWGDGNSDPLWSVTYNFPPWLSTLLPERYPS